MNTDNKTNILPSHLKVTPIRVSDENGNELFTLYTSEPKRKDSAVIAIVKVMKGSDKNE